MLQDIVNTSLIDYRARRRDLVDRMAKDLIKYEGYVSEADAIRSLFGRGYTMADIVMLVDDAMMLAYQEIVGREMSKS
jgi:SpoVK/Ycf46/Vps4 family AAA+-type ATPase